MFRPLYDFLIRLSAHPKSLHALAAVSFAESSFFPIPPDAMVIPMVLARRDRAFTIATVCTVASVIGGMFGYAIGYFLYDTLGQWLIGAYGLQKGAQEFQTWYTEWGTAVILIKGLTPIPYKLVTIASGAAHFNFLAFILASVVTRGVRFFAIAALLRVYGEPVQAFIEKRLDLVSWSFLALVIGGIAAVTLI
ncbi:MAG: DedA family protein [Alphaproteobacteria bacterium]|nr:DedA family protein [Alphaproteobacteria bacterium]PHY01088.1 MAG: cytochrome B [Rhodospirillaceae bacterium]